MIIRLAIILISIAINTHSKSLLDFETTASKNERASSLFKNAALTSQFENRGFIGLSNWNDGKSTSRGNSEEQNIFTVSGGTLIASNHRLGLGFSQFNMNEYDINFTKLQAYNISYGYKNFGIGLNYKMKDYQSNSNSLFDLGFGYNTNSFKIDDLQTIQGFLGFSTNDLGHKNYSTDSTIKTLIAFKADYNYSHLLGVSPILEFEYSPKADLNFSGGGPYSSLANKRELGKKHQKYQFGIETLIYSTLVIKIIRSIQSPVDVNVTVISAGLDLNLATANRIFKTNYLPGQNIGLKIQLIKNKYFDSDTWSDEGTLIDLYYKF